MKTARILSVLLVASSMSVPAFAATGQAKVASVQGQASASTTNGSITELKADGVTHEGDAIETGAGSALELQLSGGATLVLGPSTRIRLKSLQDADSSGGYSYEIVLLRGTLSGNATGGAGVSNISVRTTAGVANVGGSRFSLGFVPTSLTTGNFSAATSSGPISILPNNGLEPIVVPAGSQTLVGANIQTPQITQAPASTLSRANGVTISPVVEQGGLIRANAGIQPQLVIAQPVPLPNLGQVNIYNPTFPNSSVPISPNGEGSIN